MRELKQNEVNQVSAGYRNEFGYFTPEGPSYEPPISVATLTTPSRPRYIPGLDPVSPRPNIDF